MSNQRDVMIGTLTKIQNDPLNWGRDIMSIAGLMSDDELAEHVRQQHESLVFTANFERALKSA